MTEKIDYMSWSEDSSEFLPKLRRVFQDINIRIASIEDTGRKLADIERRYGVVALERISDAITPVINEARELLTKVEIDLAALDQAYRQDGQQRVDDIINPLLEQSRTLLEKVKTDLAALDLAYRQEGQRRVDDIINPLLVQTRQLLEKSTTDLAAIDLAYRQDGQRRVDEIINPLLTQTKKTLADAEAALTAINAIVSTMQPMAAKGQPDGYAGLDAAGKVPAAQLPSLTNSTTVGAALAAPTPSTTLADGDKIGGILSGGSKLATWSWGTVKAWIQGWITKAMVGLGNVDNTSDANKPVSTAQQAALDGKLDKNAQAADSLQFNGETASAWQARINANGARAVDVSPGTVIGANLLPYGVNEKGSNGMRVFEGWFALAFSGRARLQYGIAVQSNQNPNSRMQAWLGSTQVYDNWQGGTGWINKSFDFDCTGFDQVLRVRFEAHAGNSSFSNHEISYMQIMTAQQTGLIASTLKLIRKDEGLPY